MIPPLSPQIPQIPIEQEAMTNMKNRATINSLTQLLATQVARDIRVHVVPNASTTTSRIRDLKRMNPHTFFGSKVEQDPLGFTEEVFKLLDAMRVSYQQKEELPPTHSKMWLKFCMSNGRMRGQL